MPVTPPVPSQQSNPYDQFDEKPEPNPYDQFDEKPEPNPYDQFDPQQNYLADKARRFGREVPKQIGDVVASPGSALQSAAELAAEAMRWRAVRSGDLTEAEAAAKKQEFLDRAGQTAPMQAAQAIRDVGAELGQVGTRHIAQPDPARDAEIGSAVATGAASLAPLLAAGAVAPIAAIPAAAGMMGEQQRQDAAEKGATPTQQAAAFALGAPVGAASEALLGVPALLASVRGAKAVPGALSSAAGGLDAMLASTLGKSLPAILPVAQQAVKSAVREGVQEGLEQIAQNTIAKDVVGYDPTRDRTGGAGMAMLAGGIVGGGVGAGHQAAHELGKPAAQRDLESAQRAQTPAAQRDLEAALAAQPKPPAAPAEPVGNFVTDLMAKDAAATAAEQEARAKEESARTERQKSLDDKKARFDERLTVARQTLADPAAPFAAVKGALESISSYADDNSLGLTQTQREQAMAAQAALAKRHAQLAPAATAAADAEAATRRAEAQLAADAKAEKVRRERAALQHLETTGRDLATGQITDLTAVPDEELAALDPAAEGLAPTALEKEIERRGQEAERAAATQNEAGYSLRDLILGKKSALAAAGRTQPLRLKTPAALALEGGTMAGEHRAIGERTGGFRIFADTGLAEDTLQEQLQQLGFTAPDVPTAYALYERALNGEDIRPERGEENQVEFAETPASATPANARSAPAPLTDPEVDQQLAALRREFPALTRDLDLRSGLVSGELRTAGYRGPVPAGVQAAILQIRGEKRLLVIAAQAARSNQGADLFLHEMAHPFFDSLPTETKTILRELHAREMRTKTGPLFDAAGQLTTDRFVRADQFSPARLAADPDLPIKEWFAERVRALNSDWLAGRIPRDHSTLVRVWRELLAKLRAIFARVRGLDTDSDLFTETFRRWLDTGAKASAGLEHAGLAYATERKAEFASFQDTLDLGSTPLGLTLPNEIRNLAPRWQDKTLTFDSSLDKALFYAGGTNSETRTRITESLAAQTKLSPGQIATLARQLRQRIAPLTRSSATNGTIRIPAQMQSNARQLTGVDFAAAKRSNPETAGITAEMLAQTVTPIPVDHTAWNASNRANRERLLRESKPEAIQTTADAQPITITITPEAYRHSFGAANGPEAHAILAQIPALTQSAKWVGASSEELPRDVRRIHRYVHAVQTGDRIVPVRLTVFERPDGSAYLYDAQPIGHKKTLPPQTPGGKDQVGPEVQRTVTVGELLPEVKPDSPATFSAEFASGPRNTDTTRRIMAPEEKRAWAKYYSATEQINRWSAVKFARLPESTATTLWSDLSTAATTLPLDKNKQAKIAEQITAIETHAASQTWPAFSARRRTWLAQAAERPAQKIAIAFAKTSDPSQTDFELDNLAAPDLDALRRERKKIADELELLRTSGAEQNDEDGARAYSQFSNRANEIDAILARNTSSPTDPKARLADVEQRLADLSNSQEDPAELASRGRALEAERDQIKREIADEERDAATAAAMRPASEIKAEDAARSMRHPLAVAEPEPGDAWAMVPKMTDQELAQERERITTHTHDHFAGLAPAEHADLRARVEALKAEQIRRGPPAGVTVTPIPKIDRQAALITELRRGRDMLADAEKFGNFTAIQEGKRIVALATQTLDAEFPGWKKNATDLRRTDLIAALRQAERNERAEVLGAESWVKEYRRQLDAEFPGWDAKPKTPDPKPETPTTPPPTAEAAQPGDGEQSPFSGAEEETMPERTGKFNEVYGHDTYQPSFLLRSWRKIRDAITGIKGPIPELPTFPAAAWNKLDTFIREHGPQFYARVAEGERSLKGGNDYIQRTAEEQVGRIIKPLLTAGDKFNADDYAQLRRRQEQARRLHADGKPVPPGVAAEIAALNSKMETSPYVLFNRLVLALDLNWRQQNLKDSAGNPIRLPAGVNARETAAEVQRLGARIAASPHAALIKTAIEQHMALVKDTAGELKSRELLAPDHLANPYYFPHITLETTRGGKTEQRELRPSRVRPGTEADFRGYLVDPVGSTKAISTDYVRSMYYHLVQVGAHNFKADAVRDYFRPYDIKTTVEARAKELTKQRGRPVSWEQAFHEEFAPRGYVLYGTDSRDAFPTVTVNRDALARRLGVMLTSADIHQQLKELGHKDVKLLPEDLRETLAMGARETWILPARVAEAIRGIADRASAQDNAIEAAAKFTLGIWKGYKLFMPWNHIRYEFGNIVADTEKILSSSPGTFKQLPAAAKELRAFWTGGEPSADLRAALKEGVINAITAQELDGLVRQKAFEALQTRGEKAWDFIKRRGSSVAYQPATQLLGLGDFSSPELSALREAVTRYAKFKNDLAAIRAGARPDYAGAYWRNIEAMTESRPGAGDADVRKAAAISKATFGDYGDLSVGGQTLRDRLVPFYSWMEINFRYHANLLRNLRDMVRSGEIGATQATGQAARTAAVAAAGLSARTAGAIALRLALPYMAVALWNNSGDRDELEKLLSEEDRRRFHLIVGRDAQGRVQVVYGQTALNDVIKWFSGQKFASAMGQWFNGKTDFQTAIGTWKDAIAPDLANNLVGSVGPAFKIPYAIMAKKSTFPDVTDQKTIPAYDMRRNIISQMTDEFTADAIERTVNKDYYGSKEVGDWAKQLIMQVRQRDPESWAFYAIKDKANDYLEKRTGTKRDSAMDAPDQQVLRNFRRAIYRGDVDKAVQFYQRLLDYGYTAERFQQSIQSQDPLSALPKENGLRQQFVASLDADDRAMLDRAYAYYQRMSSSKGRERQLFPAKASGLNGQMRYQAQPRTEQLRAMMERTEGMSEDEIRARGLRDERRSLQRTR